jgi:hypothetical protein
MRQHVDFSSVSDINYKDFKKKHPTIKLSYKEWRAISNSFVDHFRTHILETGERGRLPNGLGEFTIRKKKRDKTVIINGKEYINLPVDWKASKEKGKKIYNFNYHTDGFFFGWLWCKRTTIFRNSKVWVFRPARVASRSIARYIFSDEKYKDIYKEWSAVPKSG